MTTEEFVRKHREQDVRNLAFVASRYPDVDAAFALDQIRGWQVAVRKLPSWARTDGLLYPPHLSMEQCSSEQTAAYKAALAARLLSECERPVAAPVFVDLTGGFGVDFSFIASSLHMRSVYVERNSQLCDLATRNLPLLGLPEAEVVCADSVAYASSMPCAAVVYLDPARRDQHGARTYGIEDCTPNLLELIPLLMSKSEVVLVKLSPMLDWHNAVRSVNARLTSASASEVHIVSVDNECKELLLVITHGHKPFVLTSVNNAHVFTVADDSLLSDIPCLLPGEPCPQYLFEPNASIMKAGCFAHLCRQFSLRAVGPNSHFFASSIDQPDFPGRRFRVVASSTMNRKEMRAMLAGLDKANITVRNFPLTVADLRKRLRLRDGGDTYLLATTTSSSAHVLFRCQRL